uniref:Uncharacterized protein n=1 Tax=Romanomermis culicivorax TaxID=13658 RepID=A0A915IN69_ROMCU
MDMTRNLARSIIRKIDGLFRAVKRLVPNCCNNRKGGISHLVSGDRMLAHDHLQAPHPLLKKRNDRYRENSNKKTFCFLLDEVKHMKGQIQFYN